MDALTHKAGTTQHEHAALIRRALLLCALAAVLEVVVFNAAFWRSLLFPAIDGYEVTCGAGLTPREDGSFTVTGDDTTITFSNIDAHVDNVHLAAYVYTENGGKAKVRPLDGSLSITDEGTAVARRVTEFSTYERVPESTYLRIHTSGPSTQIVLDLDASVGDSAETPNVLVVRDAALNARRPFMLRPLRMAVVAAVAAAVLALRRGSRLRTTRFSLGDRRVMAVCALATLAIFAGALGWTKHSSNDETTFFQTVHKTLWPRTQYEMLARSFLQGRLDLDLPVPSWLAEMDNPYDTTLRTQLSTEEEPYYFDVAFYDGHYYCYFGTVPALLVECPVLLLTGKALSTGDLAAVWMGLAAAGLTLFVRRLFARFFPRASLAGFFLGVALLFLGSGYLYHLLYPQTYSVPYNAGFACLFLGFYAWLRSMPEKPAASDLRAGTASPHPKPLWLALGSLGVALAAGCRPTFLVGALLGVPLALVPIAELGTTVPGTTSRDEGETPHTLRAWLARCVRELPPHLSPAALAAAIAPFALVFCVLGWYNWARFGSPFDFGAAYNLTSNDMTHRGFVLARLPLGLFEYLLQTPNLSPSFPFFSATSEGTIQNAGYLGFTSAEPISGGFVWFNSWAVVCLAWTMSRWRRLWRRDDPALGRCHLTLVGCAVGIALVELFAVIQYSGITQRYMSDFGWALCLAALPAFVAAVDAGQTGGATQADDTAQASNAAQTSISTRIGTTTQTDVLGDGLAIHLGTVVMACVACTLVLYAAFPLMTGSYVYQRVWHSAPSLYYLIRSSLALQ